MEVKRVPTLTAKKQPPPTAIPQAAAGDLISAEKIRRRRIKQGAYQDVRHLPKTPEKSSITPAKKVKIYIPEQFRSDVVKSLTSQGRPVPRPHHQDISSYYNEPCLNILDHHCDIWQD